VSQGVRCDAQLCLAHGQVLLDGRRAGQPGDRQHVLLWPREMHVVHVIQGALIKVVPQFRPLDSRHDQGEPVDLSSLALDQLVQQRDHARPRARSHGSHRLCAEHLARGVGAHHQQRHLVWVGELGDRASQVPRSHAVARPEQPDGGAILLRAVQPGQRRREQHWQRRARHLALLRERQRARLRRLFFHCAASPIVPDVSRAPYR